MTAMDLEKSIDEVSVAWRQLSDHSRFTVLYGPVERHGAIEWRSAHGADSGDEDRPRSDRIVRYVSLAIMQQNHQYDYCAELRVAAEDRRGFGRRPIARVEHIDPEQLPGFLSAHWNDAITEAVEMSEPDLTSTHLPRRQAAASDTSGEAH